MQVTITEEQCGIQCKANHKVTLFCLHMLYWYDVIFMIMIVNNVDSTKLENLNSSVEMVTYMYETINTRCDTEWTIKLSLILTMPSK